MQIEGLKPSLVPSGELLRHNFAPLTGELSDGILSHGINNHSLSGVIPTHFENALRYTSLQFLFDENSALETIFAETADSIQSLDLKSLKVPVLRLLLTNTSVENKVRIRNHLQSLQQAIPSTNDILPNRYVWREALSLLGIKKDTMHLPVSSSRNNEFDSFGIGSVAFVKRSSSSPTLGIVIALSEDQQRYTMLLDQDGVTATAPASCLEPVTVETLRAVNQQLEKPAPTQSEIAFVLELLSTQKEKLDHLITLIDEIKPLEFDAEDLALLQEPFPLVAASYTIVSGGYVHSDIKGEILARGPQRLGQDIQLFFAPQKNVHAAESYLKKRLEGSGQQVQVLSLNAVHYLLSKTAVGHCIDGRPYYHTY